MNKKVTYKNIGLIDYKKAWDHQESLFDEIVSLKEKTRKAETKQQTPNYLLFCEHPHVYTIGKSGKQENLLIGDEFLKSKGASFYRINRGGDITYHGPGQIVGYPILDLDNFGVSIKNYIYNLEEVIIRTLHHYDIVATRLEGATGVWLDADNPLKARKICAIGVRTSHWVSMHGFALNINTNLDYFDYIVPCGIQGRSVTSLKQELGKHVDILQVQNVLKQEFHIVFGMNIS
ncbi:MAG: lipoyl(octanoyl) transferase LipB [Bacteroidetes bacterium]|nr:lipoyl(octanoyl) transferase LipB [Bacteroidota bacterium]MBL6943341.1 lipoyl(octanoyl) transferase LipB [Bacteroidales bacterium]